MTSGKARPTTIAEYINAAPKAARKPLGEMRATIRKAAPGATEGLKWGMPALSYRRILVTFAAHQHHIGFYPTPSAVKAFSKELAKYVTARGSIQFPLGKPLPLPLIRRITAFRVRESIEQDGKWRS
ncbi:MAG: iron chaperone [Gemmatimonadales bacterium]